MSSLHQSRRREEAIAAAGMRMQLEQDPSRSFSTRQQLDLRVVVLIRRSIWKNPVAHESKSGYILRRDDLPSPPLLLLLLLRLPLNALSGLHFFFDVMLERRRVGGIVGWDHDWRDRRESEGMDGCGVGGKN